MGYNLNTLEVPSWDTPTAILDNAVLDTPGSTYYKDVTAINAAATAGNLYTGSGINYTGYSPNANPRVGDIYTHPSTGGNHYFDGTTWIPMSSGVSSVNGMTGEVHLSVEHDQGYESKFMRDSIKAVKKGLLTPDQAFRLMEMITGMDVESKELAEAILNEKQNG